MNDNNYIKHVKPSKKSRYHQGYIDKTTLKKYFCENRNEPIIYRSGLELQFIQYCENNPKIVKWASETLKIPYFNRIQQKQANYYPDYIIEDYKGERTIVEIKPYNQTIKPTELDSRWLKTTWITNIDKWTAAKQFADAHNLKFIIITEKFFE